MLVRTALRMELRRSWSGLEVALIATQAGVTLTLPPRDHRLVCHLGGPPARRAAPTTGRITGSRAAAIWTSSPAGVPGIWEHSEAGAMLLIGTRRSS